MKIDGNKVSFVLYSLKLIVNFEWNFLSPSTVSNFSAILVRFCRDYRSNTGTRNICAAVLLCTHFL